jgi:(E)-4-hydroxy-3-methylbut-2-enyl-diphosphate synthase
MNKKITRKTTREIKLGNLLVGKDNPILIQSMTNTDTKSLPQTLKQLEDLIAAGCEIARISVPDLESITSFIDIKSRVNIPLVADIHFDAEIAMKCLDKGCGAIRINPGNIGNKDLVSKIVEKAKQKDSCIRIGVNSGSLEKEILKKYGSSKAEALAESALNWTKFFENLGYYNFKVSVKSSNIEELIKANQIVSSKTDAPLHIGLTEAGTIVSGLVKSSLALSKLLENGIGDTIRISLSSNPVDEVIAGKAILKSLGLRRGLEIISCPTCARTQIDVISIAQKLEREFSWINKDLKIAVMGCVVNGPGEAREADAGIAGGKGEAVFFVNGEIIKKVSFEAAYLELRKYIIDKVKGVING